ncbi:MAG: ATP-binding protein [Halosimplex sp.]
MQGSNGEGVRVGVVGPRERRDEVRAVLAADEDVTVADGAADGVEASEGIDCAVATSVEAYDRVREDRRVLPVVVVAAGVERETLERVVDDPRADHVHPDADLATTLPARLARLVAGDESTTAWRLADFADEAVVEFDPETLALREANDTFHERWGLAPSDLDGATVRDLQVTDITHELRGQGRGAEGEEELEWIDDEDPVTSMVERARGGNYETREWHCVDDDGAAFKTEVDLVVDESGRTGYLVADVPAPERERREGDPLDHDEGAMLRSLVEHVPMSVYFKDDRSRHVLVSQDVVEPFVESPEGKIMHTPEDVRGKTDFDLYEAVHAEAAVEDDRRVVESGEPIRDRVEHAQPPNGQDLFYQTTKAPWYDSDGRARGIVGVTVDVTEQKHRERELDRQNERLEEFAGILSHDLRNPLNVARGQLQLYERNGDDAALAKVREMHERMEDLVEEVLAYAREGSHIDEMEWIAGRDEAERAWESVDTGAATLETGDWVYSMRADPDRLERLFENCYRNAVEHGGEDVTVTVGTLDDEPGFYVEDDGPGIPAEEREAVFERGVTSDDEGTGFGLAIVREIADAHGWDVVATESESGGVSDERGESEARERDSSPGARFEVTGITRGDDLDAC